MKILFFIYQWCVAIPVLVIATIVVACVTVLGCMFGLGKWAGYYPPHIWARLWCWLLFVKVEVRGRENIDKHISYIFVANHQGAYDIFSIYGFLNHRFCWMMKKSLEKIPFVGAACRAAGHIMVDHSSAAAVKHTMQDAESRLKSGNSLVIFPEGARTWTGKMRPFKRGAFILAQEYKLPLVPVTIDGAFRVMPRTTYNIRPGKIILTIHHPIPAPTSATEMDDVIKQCFASVQSSLPESCK